MIFVRLGFYDNFRLKLYNGWRDIPKDSTISSPLDPYVESAPPWGSTISSPLDPYVESAPPWGSTISSPLGPYVESAPPWGFILQ